MHFDSLQVKGSVTGVNHLWQTYTVNNFTSVFACSFLYLCEAVSFQGA